MFLMTQPVPSLHYASANSAANFERQAHIFRRIALGCALSPMAIGLVIVFLYWVFDWSGLILAGLIMLPLGALTVLTGLIIVLLWHWQQVTLARKLGTRAGYRPQIVMAILLLANFPVAFVCGGIGADLANQPTICVVVHNDTKAPISPCTIRSRRLDQTQALKPGDDMIAYLTPRRSAGLRLHVEQTGQVKEIPLVVTSAFHAGGTFRVTVGPAFDLQVKETYGDTAD
jgi:hypothetical protein